MTDYSKLLRPDNGQDAHMIHLVSADGFETWSKSRSAPERAAMAGQKFSGDAASFAILPQDGESWSVVAGVDDPEMHDPSWLPSALSHLYRTLDPLLDALKIVARPSW